VLDAPFSVLNVSPSHPLMRVVMSPRIPLPTLMGRAGHLLLCAVVTVVAISVAWHFWKWSGLAIPFLWGAAILLAMRSGIERAPPEAWERTDSRGISIAVKSCFFLIVFAPVVIPAVCGDLIAAAAWLWITVIGFSLSHLLYRRLRGHITSR